MLRRHKETKVEKFQKTCIVLWTS